MIRELHVKLVAFGTSVNVTLGLPIIRTSVDHGTAFDIAGKGVADHGSMVQAVRADGKQAVFFNVPYANEAMFPSHIARDTHERRDYHNERLRKFCSENSIPLANICSHLRDEHLGDELHPNEAGARIIAERVFGVLASIHTAK